MVRVTGIIHPRQSDGDKVWIDGGAIVTDALLLAADPADGRAEALARAASHSSA
jgi:hypothetical protein